MSPVNRHGQPIGEPVEWSPRERPGGARLAGRYVDVEPLRPDHAEPLWHSLCGPDDAPLWTYRQDEPPADVAAMTARLADWGERTESLTYALVPTATGRAAGVASFYRIDPEHGSIEVGAILLGRSLQRTPAATEVIQLLAGHVFDDLGYRRFEWKLDALNAPSAAAARRFGFRYEGRFRNAMVYKGRNRDTDWFAMTDDDWHALRPAYDAWLHPDNFDEDGQQRTRLSDWQGRTMEKRVSFITLAVADLVATRRFYVDGLGWEPAMEEAGEVLMFAVADKVVLSLWAEAGFEAEVGPIRRGSGHAPVTLAHNVATKQAVDDVLAHARAAGSPEVVDAVEREWGGYTGYFADPAGFRWEVAFNPGPIGQTVL